MRPLELRSSDFLDLAHRYVLLVTDPDHHDEINRELLGPLHAVRVVRDPRTGEPQPHVTPPSWWHGDEDATRSSLDAALALRHRM